MNKKDFEKKFGDQFLAKCGGDALWQWIEKYAEEMCEEQKNLCAEEFFKTFNLENTFVEGMNKIKNAPLPQK